MAAGLDLGTLTVKLAADVDELKKGLADATRQTEATNKALKRMGEVAFGAVEGMGGAFNEASTMLKKVRKGVEDVFGEDATAAGQAWGRELQKSVGLTEAQVKGLGQAVKGLEGAFEVAAMASKALLSPLGAALLAVVGLTAAWGGLKQLLNTKGWLPEIMDEPWIPTFKPSATPGWEGVAFNRRAPGPKGAAAEQAYGKFFDPMTGQYKSAGPVTAVADPGPAGPGIGERAKDGLNAAMEGFTKSLKEGAKEFEPALKAFMDMLDGLTPGTKKSGSRSGGKNSDAKGLQDEIDKNMKQQRENAEWMASALKEQARRDQQEADDAEQAWREIYRAEEDRRKAELEHIQSMTEMVAAHDNAWRDELAASQAEMKDRWSALGSGQLGDAAGVKGLGGGVLNMLGSAAAGYQRTGAVLQGAGQGLQSSGGNPWGAVVGAIIGLLTQTKAFSGIMEGIEDILGAVVGLLDTTMKPIMKVLNPIFKIISDLISAIDLVTTALDGVIGEQGMGKSIGDKDDQWGKYSLNDWINGGGITPLLSELGDWIGDRLEDKDAAYNEYKKQSVESLQAQNTDSQMSTRLMGDASYQSLMAASYYSQRDAGTKQRDLERQFAMTYESMHELEIRAAYLDDAIYDLGSQARQSANELYMLNTAAGGQAYIDAQVKAAEVQHKKSELDAKAAEIIATFGWAVNDATKSVQQFSDAFKNVPIGYKLALSMYGSQTGLGAGSSAGAGGGGGGAGGGAAAAAGGGGGGGVTIQNVQITSDDPEKIWVQLKRVMARDNYVRGGTLASRAPVGV